MQFTLAFVAAAAAAFSTAAATPVRRQDLFTVITVGHPFTTFGIASGSCISAVVDSDPIPNGTPIVIDQCAGGSNAISALILGLTQGVSAPLQTGPGTVCVDAGSASPTNGASLTLENCNGSAQQNWTYTNDHTIQLTGTNQCLTAVSATTLQVDACTAGNNQQIFSIQEVEQQFPPTPSGGV